jgi:cytochrome c oxidase subunit IV
MSWFAGLLILSSLVGFILALTVFLLAFFRIRAGCRWAKTLILSSAGILFMCFMAYMLNRDFPPGLLQFLVDLPWPFSGF